METHQVIPDVLDTEPLSVATVTYVKANVSVQLGKELTPTQVQHVPAISWQNDENKTNETLYTILFTDPDAPSRLFPTYREILHWLVINVPSSKDISAGETIVPYIGSGAPQGTGLHRYIFTIYKQAGRLSAEELRIKFPVNSRFKFSTRNFVAQFNLGIPIAGNFFQAQFDEFVREKRGQRLVGALLKDNIIPDVIDTAPALTAEVKYNSNVIMNFGTELTPTQVKDIPEFVTWREEENALYTVCLTDPDAPSRVEPKIREFLHWLVVNIPGGKLSSSQNGQSETLAEYVGSGPPKGTGLHRYVLLVYKQANRIDKLSTSITETISNNSCDGRANFSIRKFAQQNKLGQPVAANFYQSQYDDYVPTLHKQLNVVL